MFSVDYATLSQIIQQFLYTGVFRASVANSRFFAQEGRIELQAKEGVIIACRFVTRQGSISPLDRWEVRLAQLGILNWELATSTEAMSKRTSPSSEDSFSQQPSSALPRGRYAAAPHRAVVLPPAQIRQWPILYRQVYALIDGRRQLADIALTLRRSQQEIAQIIDELIRRRLIALE